MQRRACRVVREDRRHSCSFVELLAEPSPLLPVLYFLKREVNRFAKNLSYALFGGALCAVMRYSPAELR